MSVYRPQTFSAMFAILTIFATSAWGQRMGTETPIYTSSHSIFGADSLVDRDGRLKAAINGATNIAPPAARRSVSSDLGADSLVNRDGMLKGAIDGVTNVASPTTRNTNSSSLGANSFVDRDGRLKGVKNGAATAASSLKGSASKNTIGSKLGSDSLVDKDGRLKATLEKAKGLAASTDKKDTPGVLASHKSAERIDSLFASSEKQLVNKDGYLLSSAWEDAKLGDKSKLPGKTDRPGAGNTEAQDQSQVGRLSKFRLRVGFDALSFSRGRGESTAFAATEDGNDVSFSDFDLDDGTGRYFIQFMGDDQSGFEFTFYDFNSFSSTITATGQSPEPLFFQATSAASSATFELDYISRLKNIELNSWLRHSPTQRSGFGIRHINLDETFNVRSSANNGLFSRTDNDLWGLNRMWERRRLWPNRVSFIGGIDAGLYLNRIDIDVNTQNIDDSSEGSNLAGSLGFNLGLEYQAARHVSFRFGYEGFGLFGVGLASTQSLEMNIFDGLQDPELNSIYFGGFHVGATATF